MARLLRSICIVLLLCCVGVIRAQYVKVHKVQKKETVYGIARMYGITQEQLKQANPVMLQPDYQLKKGDLINIPVTTNGDSQNGRTIFAVDDVRQRPIRMGVLLPLHLQNNDGKRMLEYYRGILMACDSMKHEGISVDIHAWNLSEDTNLGALLPQIDAAKCDILIGPYYNKHVPTLAAFAQQHQCLMVVPFSLDIPEIVNNRYIFQIYQPSEDLDDITARRFAIWFKDYHPIIINCSDANSSKGGFTSALRKQFEKDGKMYNLTSINSSDLHFMGAFLKGIPNVVVLNTENTSYIPQLYKRLDTILQQHPDVQISVFGYTEWLGGIYAQQSHFHRFDTYIPAPFYTNVNSPQTIRLLQRYRWIFHQDMITIMPRFALSGFDHAVYFLRGLHKYGMQFDGAPGRFNYQAVQTPLKFERVGHGGLQNKAYMFIHYKPDFTIDALNY